MFIHNYRYFYKILTKNKGLLFWTLIFPIILGTFFHMAFKDIEKKESINPFNIAVVGNKNDAFRLALDEAQQGKNPIFDEIYYTNYDEAKNLLEEEKIIGIIDWTTGKPEIYVNKSGTNETILKYFVDETIIDKEIDYHFAKYNIVDATRVNISYTMIEYYTLIAMTALYGGALSIYMINKLLPNMSSMGKRIGVSPVKKKNLVLSGTLASLLVSLISMSILLLYSLVVLEVNYGDDLKKVILLAFTGCVAGISLGLFIGIVLKTNENAKSGILIAITMFLSFLSGMMGITMKYVVDKNIPILNMINPANMITDGLYSLYYYTYLDRYYFNLISLIIFSLTLIVISSLCLRRQKYDSI